MLSHLYDPLLHIIRNAIDHGIETGPVRKAAGKSEEGNLILRARQEASYIRIDIEESRIEAGQSLALKAAGRPPDENHPYGHHSFETLGATLVALFMLLTAVMIGLVPFVIAEAAFEGSGCAISVASASLLTDLVTTDTTTATGDNDSIIIGQAEINMAIGRGLLHSFYFQPQPGGRAQ